MGTPFLLHASVFLVAVTFFMKDVLALECHSCVDLGDGGCNAENMKKVECPASSDVCVETVAAVEWSHGKFSIGEKGCGAGMSGTNDKAVDVHGILAFSQLHQCNSSHCNTKLDIKNLELEPIGNESARVPNGIECYSCYGNECSLDNSTTVKCYDSFRGCFHGNVTMKAGNFSLTRPLKGCVQDEDCTKVTKGSPAITVMGSCCSGSLCNVDLSNKTYFAPKIPRLAVLPGQGSNATVAATTATATTTSAHTRNSSPAPSTAGKPIRSVAVSSPSSSRDDHDHDHDDDHDHDHDDDHDHDHDHNHDHDNDHDPDHDESSVRDGKRNTAVKVEGRQSQHPTKGAAAGLGQSVLLSLLLAGLLL